MSNAERAAAEFEARHESKSPSYITKFAPPMNFFTWLTSLRIHMKDVGVWGAASGEDPDPYRGAPVDGDANIKEEDVQRLSQERAKWLRRNDKAFNILYNSLDDSVKPRLVEDNAEDLLQSLMTMYGQQTLADIAFVIRDLANRRKESGESMQRFMQDTTNLFSDIEAAERGLISERLWCILVATNMPSEYSQTVNEVLNDLAITIEKFRRAFVNADAALKATRQVSNEEIRAATSSAVAMKTTTNTPSTSAGKFPPCSHCNKTTHKADDCFKLEKNASKRPPWYRVSKANVASSSSVDQAQRQRDDQLIESVADAIRRARALVTKVRRGNEKAHFVASKPQGVEVLVDCGASCHMFKHGECVLEQKPCTDSVVTTAEEGRDIQPKGQGTVVFQNDDGAWALPEALHVPSLAANLVSLGEIHGKGSSFHSEGDRNMIIVSADGSRVVAVRGDDNLYRLQGSIKVESHGTVSDAHLTTAIDEYTGAGAHCATSTQVAQSSPSASTATPTPAAASDVERQPAEKTASGRSWQDWHEVFGHASDNILAATLKHYNIPLPTRKRPECRSCKLGKLTSQPYVTRSSLSKARDPLGRVHVDLWGPAQYPTIRGSRYFLTLVDEATNFTTTIPLPSKDGAAIAIQMWTTVQERQTGFKLKIIRSDKGGEFMSASLAAWMRKLGIKHEVTVVGVSAQDGKAERMHRTLLDIVRTWNVEHQMPKSAWGELVSTAATVLNRRWTSSVGGVPMWLWSKTKPNVGGTLPVGPCYVHVQKQGQDKFAPRALEGWIVGYEDSHTYRIWVNDAIIVARDVVKRIIGEPFSGQVDAMGLPLNVPSASDDRTMVAASPPSEDEGASSGGESEETVTPASVSSSAPTPPSLPAAQEEQVQEEQQTLDRQQQEESAPGPSTSSIPAASTANAPSATPSSSSSTASATPSTPSTEQPQPRSSSRQAPPPRRYGYVVITKDNHHTVACHVGYAHLVGATEISHDPDEPRTYEEAMRSPYAAQWKAACDLELHNQEKNKSWCSAELPFGRKPITAKWVFKLKRDSDGKIIQFKARLCARGFGQIEGLDFDKTHAPVSRLGSFRCLLALAVQRGMVIHHFDVETAFLNGECDTEIYMIAPEGTENAGQVVRLLKSLYGLKQAPRIWYEKLSKTLKDLGFEESAVESCLFERPATRGDYAIILIYVDDLVVIADSLAVINSIYAQLSKSFIIKDLGTLAWYLGLKVNYDEKSGRITINQEAYINELVERFGLADAATEELPMAPGLKFKGDDGTKSTSKTGSEPDSSSSSEEETSEPKLDVPYAQLIGCLLYVAMGTRPDVAVAVQKLAQRTHRVTQAAWTAAKQVLRYLKGTKDLAITYARSDEPASHQFAGYVDAGESGVWGYYISGYLYTLAGGPVTWSVKRQTKIAKSTQHAELNAAYVASLELDWLSKFKYLALWLKKGQQVLDIERPITLFVDNQGAIAWVQGKARHSATKHYKIELRYLRQEVNDEKSFELTYIRTDKNLADCLTKPLELTRFEELRASMNVVPTTS